MIKQMIDFIMIKTETEKTKSSTKYMVFFVAIFLALCSAVMSAVNFLNSNGLMLATTIALTLSFLTCVFICFVSYHQNIIAWILGVTLVCTFSLYLVIGGNEGFAIDWILLVPVAFTTLFGLAGGLLVGGYFWVFIILCLWTPIHSALPYTYSDLICLRFPILYTCGFFLAMIIGIRNKKFQIEQMQHEARLYEAVLAERKRVEHVSMNAVSSICRALDARDPYTMAHSDHVAEYSGMIARSLGWTEEKIEVLIRAAKVHDLGKIGIPDYILKKQGALTHEEFAIMKQHVTLGTNIVSDFSTMPELAVGVKYHHERYDGKGYDTGISGEDIPIVGRIIALADAIDAMSSDRVYREKKSKAYLLDELKCGAGTQFDPALVDAAISLIENGMLEQVNKSRQIERSGYDGTE